MKRYIAILVFTLLFNPTILRADTTNNSNNPVGVGAASFLNSLSNQLQNKQDSRDNKTENTTNQNQGVDSPSSTSNNPQNSQTTLTSTNSSDVLAGAPNIPDETKPVIKKHGHSNKTFKIYLSVSGDEVYKDIFTSSLRLGLRQYDDVVFVNSPEKAFLIVTISVLADKTVGGVLRGFDVAMAVNTLCQNPDLYQLSGPDNLEEIAKRTVADINENVLEPLREAVVK